MLTFRLRTLFLLVFLVSVVVVLVPAARQIYQWNRGLVQLAELSQSNYLQYGYEDVNAVAKPAFEDAFDRLRQLGPFAKDADKFAILESCVLRLNAIQYDSSLEHSIETVEREQYCDILCQLGDIVGIDFDEKLLDLRDW